MFIKNIDITNYKIFKDTFSVNFSIPDGTTLGSGLTIFCGENGNGKSSIHESITLALQDYRSEGFSIESINDLAKDTEIKIQTTDFGVTTVLPDGHKFNAKGFYFKGNKRKRVNGDLYGSLVVTGRKIVSTESQKDYELRCDGSSPWGNPRYEQPLVLSLDKNRIYQTRKGNTTSTNFDLLLERLCLDLQNTENEKCEYDLSKTHPLQKAFTTFENMFHIPLKLYKTNPQKQMENAFVASYTDSNVIKLSNLGSGYEMFFSILWAIYRSFDDKRDLIILLDEPELHLHPSMQEKLIELLKSYSNKVQIIISTHSPLFIKQLYGINPLFHILEKVNDIPCIRDIKEQKIKDYLSLNEVNFMAFGLYTEEYFNELYETLYRRAQECDENVNSHNFDERFFVQKHHLDADRPYKAIDDSKKVSFITYIRNVIHHRVDYTNAGLIYTDEDFKKSIDIMRNYLEKIE